MDDLKHQIMETYNEIADDFDPTRPHPWPETVEFVKGLSKGIRVLDLGCGNGRNSVYLAGQGLQVVGIDFSHKMLEIAVEKTARIDLNNRPNFVQADIMELPFRSSTFDAAIFIAALHHIPNEIYRLAALDELYRCIKPGGTVLISVWAFDQPKFREVLEEQVEIGDNRIVPKKRAENEPSSVPDGSPGDVYVPWTRKDGKVYKRFYHLFQEDEFKELLDRARFDVVDFYRVKNNYYGKLVK
jgi:ubiquinone/menaquinone biosynthesis C-methylase UbiE